MRWILVEATDRVMPEVSPTLAEFASRELRGRGIEIRTETTLEELTRTTARLSDGEVVQTRTCVWTAGVRPHPVVERLGLPLDDTGRIAVDKTMRVHGRANVWAIGDAAAVPDPAKKRERPCPPTGAARAAPGAARGAQRRRVARHGPRPAVLLPDARACSSTWARARRWPRPWACAGAGASPGCSPAATTSRMMPGIGRKFRLLVEWNVGLVFGRDVSELGQLGHPASLADPGEPAPREAAD